jgi:hypothetical protein
MTFRMLAALAAGSIALMGASPAHAGKPVRGVSVSLELELSLVALPMPRIETDANGAFTIAKVRCNCFLALSGRALEGKSGTDLVLTIAGKPVSLSCDGSTCRTQTMTLSGPVSGNLRSAR